VLYCTYSVVIAIIWEHFLELVTVENTGISVPEIQLLPILAAILLFPVVGRYRNHLGNFFELDVVGKLQFVSTVTTILILDLIWPRNFASLKKSTRV